MSNDLKLILNTFRTPSPLGKDPNEMEILAYVSHQPADYKHVVVNMRGVNGNTLVIVGTVKQALKRAGASALDLSHFVGEALSGDYENALATCAEWVSIVDREPKQTTDAWSAFVKCAAENDESGV